MVVVSKLGGTLRLSKVPGKVVYKEKTHLTLTKFPFLSMPCYDCPRDDCVYSTLDVPDAVAAVILQDHLHTVHPAVQACVKKAKPPSMSLPKVTRDIRDHSFSMPGVWAEWNVYGYEIFK